MSAWRRISRSPGFFAAAVLTLGLGIGVNVACFGVIRAVLLKPLGYRNPEQLVMISGGAAPVHLQEIRAAARDYSAIGAYAMEEDLAYSGGAYPQVLKTNRVSADFLQILGVEPLLGRSLTASGDTVLISYEFWQRQFQGDLAVAGRAMDLGGNAYSIAGVLPPKFSFPAPELDVWLAKPEDSPQFPPASRALSPFLGVFGRLRSGVSLEAATAELVTMQAEYARNHPAMLDAKPKTPPVAMPLRQAVVREVKPALGLLYGAVALVLLIACANLATLILARSAGRANEFAVRAALGAGSTKIAKLLLGETLILYLSGGAVGSLFAFWALAVLRAMSAQELPRAAEIGFDGAVLAYAVVLSIIAGLVFGLAPALMAARADLISVIRGSGGGRAHTGLRSFLVGGQIALSFVLLVSTLLLIQTMVRLRAEPLGFNPLNVVTARIALKPSDNALRFFDDLERRLAAVPGVAHVSASLTLPMMSYPGTPVQRADQPLLPLNKRAISGVFIVTPDYFATLEIPLKRGRTFTERDREGTARVIVIDENLAKHFWPDYPAGQNPVGQRLWVGGVRKEPAEIVGIVGNAHQDLEGSGWNRGVYVAFAQSPTPTAMIALRGQGDPMSYANAIRSSVQSTMPSQPVSEIRPMQELIEAQLGSRRMLMQLLALFSSLTLLLVLLGIYGLSAYSVTQRTRELGIRRALGAPDNRILKMVVWQALRVALAGIAVGLLGAFAGTHLLASYLFHTEATDPITLAAVCVVFVLFAMTASLMPAMRAAKVDPMTALRYE